MPLDFTDLIPDRQAKGPSFDDLIPDQKQQVGTLPDLIPDKSRQALSFDDLMPPKTAYSQSVLGAPFNRIADAAMAGAKEGYGTGAASPEAQAANALATKDLGALAPVVHGINWMSEAGGRPLNALYRGAQGGIVQLATELGMPQLGRDLAAAPEAFAGSPEALRTPERIAPSPGPGPRMEPRFTEPTQPGPPAAAPLALAGPTAPSAPPAVEASRAAAPATPESPQPGATTSPAPATPTPPSALPPLVRDEAPVAAPEPRPTLALPAPVGELPPLVRDPAPVGEAPHGDAAQSQGKVLGIGDLWSLPPDHLEDMLRDKTEDDHQKVVRALGTEEAAAEFKRLDRKQNSSIPHVSDEGSREFDAKFGNLTPEQERLIYGIGDTDAQADDIKAVLHAHNQRHDDPEDAAYEAASAIRSAPAADILAVPKGGASATAQAAFVRLKNAYEDMRAAGVSGDKIGNSIAGALVNRGGWNPGDAAEIVGGFLEHVQGQRPTPGHAAPDHAPPDRPAIASQPKALAAPDPTTAHGGPWSEIGKNHQGEPVYQNPSGVLATMDNGVPWTEATKEHPEQGRVPHDEGNRPERVQLVEARSGMPESVEGIGQKPQISASSSHDLAPEEITPPAAPGPELTKARAPRQKREPDPYTTVPKEPKRLIQFLREPTVINRGTIHEQAIPGGVRDVGGDVKAALGGSKGRPGLINNAAGRHLDDATLRAWEAGYFPEHDQRPEINDLLNAIREDHEGTPRYSIHDQDAVDAHHGALGQNDEIDRLASQHDIPTRGLTRDQFFDRLAERLEHQSLEDAAKHYAEMDASLGADVDDLDREAKQWNGDEVYGNDPPRTLEDLENEYRQEDTAGTARESSPDHEGRGRPAPPEGAGEEGSGQDGRGTRSSGRDGAPGGAGEGDRRDVDLLGAPRRGTPAARAPEFTIHNDPNQALMPGMEPSARQAQAARDAAPPKSGQKAADEGLFARPEAVQPELVPAAPAAPKTPTPPAAKRPGKANDRVRLLDAYFKPGELVPSYGGAWDRVISFTPPTSPNAWDWSVRVVHVNQDGSPIPGERERTHATQPETRDIAQVEKRRGVKFADLLAAPQTPAPAAAPEYPGKLVRDASPLPAPPP